VAAAADLLIVAALAGSAAAAAAVIHAVVPAGTAAVAVVAQLLLGQAVLVASFFTGQRAINYEQYIFKQPSGRAYWLWRPSRYVGNHYRQQLCLYF
jgi:hypothetical protein